MFLLCISSGPDDTKHKSPQDGIKLALPRSSSQRWIGGACPLAQLAPWLLIEVLGLLNWVIGCAHGLLASVSALGAGIKVLTPALQEQADGRMPSAFGRLYLD